MPLPLRQLEAFRAVVANGSMTKAAGYLKISQPAVSRLIASLERSLGFLLFQRGRGLLQPTTEARFLFDEVERALNNLENLSRLTKDIQARRAGHLRLACLPGFGTSLLPRILARFLVERPGITVTFEPDKPDRIAEWVIAQQYDVGITEQFEGHPAVQHETIAVRTVCVLPAGHRLGGKTTITPRDLDDMPIIHGNREHIFYRALHDAFDAQGVALRSSVETRQFAPACIMVAEGLGVSIVSEIDAREYESNGLLIKPFEPAIPFHISILYPAHLPRSIVTHEFVEVFKLGLAPFRLSRD